MTAVSPRVGVAPLNVVAAPVQPQPEISIHAALAGGSNLGGTFVASEDYGVPSVAAPTTPTTPTTPAAGTGSAATAPAAANATGGGGQATQGAANVTTEQLVAALEQVLAAVNQLVAILQAQGGVNGAGGTAGGGGETGGQCAMAGCSMQHAAIEQASEGANAAPTAVGAMRDVVTGAAGVTGGGAATEPEPEPKSRRKDRKTGSRKSGTKTSRSDSGADDVKDKVSTKGLGANAKRGLAEAHRFGLPLVSGHRPGGGESSDHGNGRAIDVSTLPIGAASSKEGTAEMKAFAEHMRKQGKAGKLDVKYVILDGKIASARDDWAWRDYTNPEKSSAAMAQLKSTDRGDYNRLQHYDHVHVSFN